MQHLTHEFYAQKINAQQRNIYKALLLFIFKYDGKRELGKNYFYLV